MRVKYFSCLCLIFLFGIATFSQTVSAKQTDDVRFSLTVWDQHLEEVLSDIEQITGFTILLDGQIKSDPEPGVYNNISVSDFFSIVLEEKNISVSTDSERKQITVSKVPAGNISGQRKPAQDMDAFLESESDYILKAKQSVKPTTDKEIEALYTDPQTGKPWHEIDQAILKSQKQKKAHRKFTEADFLAAESDYIEHAKTAIENIQNRSSD